MKHLSSLLISAACVMAALHAAPSLAQSASAVASSGSSAGVSASAATATQLVAGEIRKIDPDTGKITIKHGEIKNLDMPAMTMVFQTKDKVMLAKLKANDKIKFKASNENGKMTASEIEPDK